MKTMRLGALLLLLLTLTIPALATEPVVITRQPDFAYAVPLGETVTVSLEAQGEGLIYNWYRKNPDDVEFVLDAGCTDNSYELVAEQWGIQLYCIVTDSQGNQAYSDPVCIAQPMAALEIVEQPENVTVPAGKTAWVYSAISGDSMCTFTWYEKDPGAEDFTISTCTGNAYSVVMDASVDGRQVYYEVTDDLGGWAVSDIVTLTMEAGTLPEHEEPFLGKWKLVKREQGFNEVEGESLIYLVLVLNAGGNAIIDDGLVIDDTQWRAQEDSALMDGAVLTIEETEESEDEEVYLLAKYSDGTEMCYAPYDGELSLRAAPPEELFGCWQSEQGETLEFWASGAASSRDGEAYTLHLWTEADGGTCLLAGMQLEMGLYINQNGELSKNGQRFTRTADEDAYQSEWRFTDEEMKFLQDFNLGLAAGERQLPAGAEDCANADELLRLMADQLR